MNVQNNPTDLQLSLYRESETTRLINTSIDHLALPIIARISCEMTPQELNSMGVTTPLPPLPIKVKKALYSIIDNFFRFKIEFKAQALIQSAQIPQAQMVNVVQQLENQSKLPSQPDMQDLSEVRSLPETHWHEEFVKTSLFELSAQQIHDPICQIMAPFRGSDQLHSQLREKVNQAGF